MTSALNSRDIDPILDVEDPLPEAYTLEVSSPGLDRIIELDRDLTRFQQFHIRIKRVHYKSKLDGVLLSHTAEGIYVQTHVETFLAFEDISIRLHPTDEEIDNSLQGINTRPRENIRESEIANSIDQLHERVSQTHRHFENAMLQKAATLGAERELEVSYDPNYYKITYSNKIIVEDVTDEDKISMSDALAINKEKN